MSTTKITFRLKDGKKPVSWQLPLANVFLPREVNGQTEDKLVHYIPGANSIWAEDYKGQKKPEDVWFEDGEIEVSATNKLLLEILEKHRWFGIHYEKIDDEATATADIAKYDLIQDALELVDDSEDLKVRANALALLGQAAFGYTALKCRAELKKLAFTTPEVVIEEVNKPNFTAKFLVSLALLQKVIKTDDGGTAVIWGDSGNVIIRIAVGENPIEEMTKFLSKTNDDAAVITLQKIGELTSTKKDVASPAQVLTAASSKIVEEQAKELSAKDNEIAELRKQLAAKQPETKVDDVDSTDAVGSGSEYNPQEGKDSDNPPTIEDLQEQYLAKFGKEVWAPKKNDAIWILSKLNE